MLSFSAFLPTSLPKSLLSEHLGSTGNRPGEPFFIYVRMSVSYSECSAEETFGTLPSSIIFCAFSVVLLLQCCAGNFSKGVWKFRAGQLQIKYRSVQIR